jgi:hypothetical protein
MRAYEYWLGKGFELERRRVLALLGDLARSYRGELQPDTGGDVFPQVVVIRNEQTLNLKVQPNYLGREDFNLVVTVRSRKHNGEENPFPVLHCLSLDLADRDVGAPWMKPLVSGSETFDRRFLSREIPGGGAAGLLSRRVRAHLLGAYFASSRAGRPNLWFESQANFIRFKQAVRAKFIHRTLLSRLCTRGLATFLRVEGRVLHFVQPLPGKILARQKEVATCRICGEVVLSRAVSCRDCETMHHQECWEFNERCSLYACGGRDYLQVLG